jgi:phosphopantothenoylcysteine decarboxylase/phosphopantothenate--cysteine ligase
MRDRQILVGVTGGIAAYKIADLVRALKREGALVRVVMTENATRFVAPLTFETLSGNPVSLSMWERRSESATEHIDLARWANTFVIAPATANVIATLALGLADDLLSTTALATEAPLIVAPSMNATMWRHPAVLQNVETLVSRGARLVGPDDGELACGESGPGRMAAANEILAAVRAALDSGDAPAPRPGR